MTQVDFYTHVADKMAILASLSAKALQQGKRVFIYTGDAQLSETVDRSLWQNPPLGFLPHCLADAALADRTPVLINHDPARFVHDDILINLHRDIPPFFSRYQRLIEIVALEDADAAAGRERYKFYKDRGYPMQAHNVQQLKANKG